MTINFALNLPYNFSPKRINLDLIDKISVFTAPNISLSFLVWGYVLTHPLQEANKSDMSSTHVELSSFRFTNIFTLLTDLYFFLHLKTSIYDYFPFA